jgi:hypothetical protein
VFGENFESRTTITVDGSRIPTTFISAGELQGRINQGILRRAGSFEIGVFGPPPGGGSAVAEGSFRIEASKPIVESVDPATLVPAKGRVTVTVLGRNFAGNSEIIVNGNTVKTLFNSTEELLGILDREILSLAGRVPLQVNNPEGGGLSDETVFFTIEGAVPLIRNLNPSSVEAGESDVLITIRGEGFTSESIVVMSATFDGRVESRVFTPDFADERTLAVFLSETPPEGLDIGVHVANGQLLSNVEILSVTGRKGRPGQDDDDNRGNDDDRGGGNSGQGGDDDRTPPGQSGDDDQTPPGQSGDDRGGGNSGQGGDDDRTPPGQSGDDDQTPPGQSGDDDRGGGNSGQGGDDDRTPPGQSGDDDQTPPAPPPPPPDRNEEEDKLPPQFRRGGGGNDKDDDPPADNDDDKKPPGQGGDDDRTPPGQDDDGDDDGNGNSGGGNGNQGRGNGNN